MNTIDECMKYAADKDAFVSLMASEGYAVRWESGRKYITYTTPDGLKCRDNKLHEENPCLRQEQKGRQRGTARDAGDIDHTSKRTGSIRIRESSLSFCGLFKQQFSTHSV